MVTSIAALGLIFYNGVIDRPGAPSSAISVKFSWYLSLLASVVMVVASVMRSSEHEARPQPQGTIRSAHAPTRPHPFRS